MKRYEIKVDILDEGYVDALVVCMVRQGHAVYYNAEEKVVCWTITEEDITELK